MPPNPHLVDAIALERRRARAITRIFRAVHFFREIMIIGDHRDRLIVSLLTYSRHRKSAKRFDSLGYKNWESGRGGQLRDRTELRRLSRACISVPTIRDVASPRLASGAHRVCRSLKINPVRMCDTPPIVSERVTGDGGQALRV